MKTNREIGVLIACLAGVCLPSSHAVAGTVTGRLVVPAPTEVNLTTEGVLDWAQWGLETIDDFNQKAGGTNQISNFTPIIVTTGSDVAQYNDSLTTCSWTDGTPTASVTAETSGVYIGGFQNGFQVTVPADTTAKLLKVFAGGWNAQIHFEATLSDGSAAAFVDETLSDFGDGTLAEMDVRFAANSPGQTLTIKVYSVVLNNPDGNCTLDAASLAPATGLAPTVIGVSTEVQNVRTTLGSEASFSFVITNNAHPPAASSYQWYKNNQVMTNATGPEFTFLAGPDDDNAQVYCVAAVDSFYNLNNLPPQTSATGTVTVLPGVIYTNGLKVEFFAGTARQPVEAGNVGPASSISIADSFEMPINEGLNDYVRRVSGYFVPPTSGNYVFFLCADDDTDLFLSLDGSNPGHKKLIAQEQYWSNSRQWVNSAGGSLVSQKVSDTFSPDGLTQPYSGGIPLQQGHLYYLEGVQHQGTGGDNLAVTYKLVDDPDPLDGDPPKLQATNHNIALITSPTTNLVWVTEPVNITNTELKTATFISSAASDSEFAVSYQWYRNNNAVSGATTASYSFTARVADNNTQWYVIASTAEGGLSITSRVATLTVKAASFPQGLITFEDQDPADLDTDGAMQPNPYTDVQGLPTGVTATFTNFNSWNADPQHTPGGVWLLYGADGPADKAITFNLPVELPSIWVTTGPFGNVGSWLTAYLNGIKQFTFTNTKAFTLTECTNGAHLLIDRIVFSDYVDSEIDDITIVKPSSVITFSDQLGNDVPANPNPYTSAQGLWPGLTATFNQFNNWNGNTDHTPDTTDNYLLYGANYNQNGAASIIFNTWVEVPSLWVNYQGDGSLGTASLAGFADDVGVFTYSVTSSTWTEVTIGAGKPVNRIDFFNYGDSWIDDITVRPVSNLPVLPHQATLSLVKTGGTLTLSWTFQGRLEESVSLTRGWTTSANQANPQTVTVGPGIKFYRVVYP